MNSIARVRFDQNSFDLDAATTHNEEIQCRGKILVYNTMESLKKVNKNVVLRSFYDNMIKICERGDTLESAQSFLCLCYLDLKAHSVVYWFAFPALAASGHALEYDADKLRDTEGVDIEAFYQGFEQYRRAGIEGNVKPLSSYFMVVGLERGFNVKFYKVNRHNFQKLDHDEKEDCCFGFTDFHRSEYPGWPQNILVGQCVIY